MVKTVPGPIFPPGRRPYGPEANWGETPEYIYIYVKRQFSKLKKINFFLMFLSSSSVKKTRLTMTGRSLPKTLKLFNGKAVSAIQARKR
jgi:hypothetical protein